MTPPVRLVRLDGPTSGTSCPIHRELSTLGRHPSADLSFDEPPSAGLSARHAALIQTPAGWILRDLDSTNGTWLNGDRLERDQLLAAGDEIRLGPLGPLLRVELTVEGAPLPNPHRVGATPLRRATGVIGLAALAGLGWFLWQSARLPRELAVERAHLVARLDSLESALAASGAREEGMTQRLAESGETVAATREMLRTAGRERAQLDSITALVERLVAERTALDRAARFDLPALLATAADAVALVVVERVDGSLAAGTGFAVERRGDTSWVVTSRHLVVDSLGTVGHRLGLIFHGTAQNFPALLVHADAESDLALLQLVVRRGTPVVRGLSEAAEPGMPVATISFPAALDPLAGDGWRRTGVWVVAHAATVLSAGADRLDLDGYGAAGMSGSPVLNGSGEVVGMIYGGLAGTGGRVVHAVPAARIGDLLRSAR